MVLSLMAGISMTSIYCSPSIGFWDDNLVSVASPGGVALMYNLLLMMTRCFCLLIKANPFLVSANSPRSVLNEEV